VGPELVAPVPTREEVGVVRGVNVSPGNNPEVVLLVGGYGTEESTVLVSRLLLAVPVRDEGGILNGAGDPGNVLEAVPLVGGYGTELAVDSGCELAPVAEVEIVEIPVACVALPVEPTGTVELPRTEGLGAGAEDGSEETPVPGTGLPVPPADETVDVELDNGNGAELESPEYDPVDPGNALPPVDKGPTVSVKDGVVIAPDDEPTVTGGYPELVVCSDGTPELLVKLPKGADVEAGRLPEPDMALVEEFEAGYGAELGGPDDAGVIDSDVEGGLGDMPVPVAVPDEAGKEVTFVKGYGIELLNPPLALGKPGGMVVNDSDVGTGLGDTPVPAALLDGPGVDVPFVKG
jgi:hypothetical protein